LEKIVKAQGKTSRKCIQGFAKSQNTSAEACAISPAAPDVQKAITQTLQKVSKKCTGQTPSFGIADKTGALAASEGSAKALDLVHEVFGTDLDTAIVALAGTTKPGAQCQLTTLKALLKCYDTKLKEFNKCKKQGLKGSQDNQKVPDPAKSPFDQASDLEECLGFDPKGKILKDCVTKLGQQISKKCTGQSTDQLFPGCGQEDLATCVDRVAECRACLLLDVVDGLARDCDVFDDGNSNGSCVCDGDGVSPPICGGTDCDDSNASVYPGAPELCDGLDNDCDTVVDEGNPQGGGSCNTGLPGVCSAGTFTCTSGSVVCEQNVLPSAETCNGLDDDCDGVVDEGFTLNDDPVCSGGQFNLGSVSGDTGADVLTDSWYNEEWERFTITEDNSAIAYLSATVQLYSPPGVDFDLYVYCESCGGGLAGSSNNGGLSGHTDTVTVRRDDSWGVADDFTVIVEVRHFSSTMCAYWDLTITGNTVASTETCP